MTVAKILHLLAGMGMAFQAQVSHMQLKSPYGESFLNPYSVYLIAVIMEVNLCHRILKTKTH